VFLHLSRVLPVAMAVTLVVGGVAFLFRARLRGPTLVLVTWLEGERARIGERRLRAAGQAALALWFAYWAFVTLSTLMRDHVPVGQDIQIYYRGTQMWLHGGDPWAASITVGRHVFSYAGSPATTIMLAPSALFTEAQFTALWVALTGICAVLVVRRLKLPIWWLLFAPTLEAVYSGNPQIVVLALLLAGSGRLGVIADTAAVALKVYAGIPLLGERSIRRVLAAAALTVASFALAPGLWLHYLASFQAISARLAKESGGGFSAFDVPVLLVPVAIAIVLMWRRDHRVAAWLAVPALWPATEYHYSTFAMPVMSPILAVLLVVRKFHVPPIAILIDIAWRLGGGQFRRRFAAWLRPPDETAGRFAVEPDQAAAEGERTALR
jgi:hypothetical protein